MIARVVIALLALVAVQCGQDTPSGPGPAPSPIPTPPAARTYTLSGIVRDVATGMPVSFARLQFMTGINAGRLGMAESSGRYTLTELRVGSGRLSVYAVEYAAVERTYDVVADATLDLELTKTGVPDALPPFTYSGTVWDSLGSPIAGALVTLSRDSGGSTVATTGPDGRYSITVQQTPANLTVSREGFVSHQGFAPPPLAPITLANVSIRRIVRYTLQAVQPLSVGQSVILMADLDTDDGLRSTGRLYASTSSSNEAVLAAVGLGSLLARSPGTATITAVYFGVTTTMNVTVAP